MANTWPWAKRKAKIVWIDLGDLGDLVHPEGPHEQWQDHGLGLLRTILHQKRRRDRRRLHPRCHRMGAAGKPTPGLRHGPDERSELHLSFGTQSRAAFSSRSTRTAWCLAGGMHATVAADEMLAVPEFDRICQGAGENVIVDLVKDPAAFPRLFTGQSAPSMAEWPMMDRTLWPRPASPKLARHFNWPLEPECGWGPGPVATILTSRVCPWQCVFCNESSYVPEHGPQTGRPGHRRAQLPRRSLGRRLLRHPRFDVLPEPELAEGVDREVSAEGQQALDLLGGRPCWTLCASGPTCSRRWSKRPTGTSSLSALSRAATASSAS